MWFKQINRASPEQVFISVKNEFTSTMPVGHAVHWNFPIAAAGTGTGNGYGVTFATPQTGQPSGHLFAGIVASYEIPAGDHGVVQVYGYHPGVVVTGGGAGVATLFNTDFFAATNRTAASFTNAKLIPQNILGNTVGGATNAGYMAVAHRLGTLVTTTVSLAPLHGFPYAIPLGNLNGGATVATNSSGSVKAFIKAL